jgi:hypothetical protein
MATGGSVTLPTSSQDSRFDLIAVDQSGTIIYIRGTASPNPVFPDFGENIVVLASVLVRPGTTPPLTSDVVDKRIILPERFVTALDSGVLLGCYDPANALAPKFEIDHQGKAVWSSDTRLFRSAAHTLRVEDNLVVGSGLTAESLQVNDDLVVGGNLAATNFRRGDGPPTGTGNLGDVWQNYRDGGLWTWNGTWEVLSTVPIPAGIIMQSLLNSEPTGWLFLNGQQVDEERAGGLWDAFSQWQVSTPAGMRLQLPDYTNMFLRQGTPGQIGGSAQVVLTTDNLPPHKHLGEQGQQMQPSGAHGHLVSQQPAGGHQHLTTQDEGGGTHGHPVTDPGHYHAGADGGAGGYFIAMMWGGRRRIDGPFNDASHPVAVQEVPNTVRAYTGVQVVAGGAHHHWTDVRGAHTHLISVDADYTEHVHILNEALVGASKPFNISPPYAAVRYLIKT